MFTMLLAHLVAALVAPLLVRRIGRSAFYPLAVVPAASAVWLATFDPRTLGDAPVETSVPWIPAFGIDLAFRLDTLSWVLALIAPMPVAIKDLAEQFRATMTLPVLLQGETSKGQLLQQFVSAGNALLVATSSFWEGVDVRGDTLSLVIIDKLPFTSPDDPLLKARMEDCRLRGGDPFDEVQLPDAVITLKQGVGRLIRDADDRGVLVICDNRLVMRPYGATFLASLPPAPRTRDIARAVRFLAIPSSR